LELIGILLLFAPLLGGLTWAFLISMRSGMLRFAASGG
jgi:hypothetical protein